MPFVSPVVLQQTNYNNNNNNNNNNIFCVYRGYICCMYLCSYAICTCIYWCTLAWENSNGFAEYHAEFNQITHNYTIPWLQKSTYDIKDKSPASINTLISYD